MLWFVLISAVTHNIYNKTIHRNAGMHMLPFILRLATTHNIYNY